MVCQQKPIVIDPASIVAVGAMRAKRVGRPKKGVAVEDGGKARVFRLSDDAAASIERAATVLGVSESAVMEALAKSLSACFG